MDAPSRQPRATTSRSLRLMKVVITGVVVAGCSSASSPSPSPNGSEPSPTVTATATPIQTASPVPSPVMAGWFEDGRLEFSPGRAQVVRVGDEVLVVGSDNTCTPGRAWPESVRAQVREISGRWRIVESLPAPRDGFAAVSLADGRALVIGGTTEETASTGPRSYSSAYLFDPATDAWSKTGLLATARSQPFATVLNNGRVLVGGGQYVNAPDEPEPRALVSAELYDPATGVWTRTGSLPNAGFGPPAVVLADGRVLVIGGAGPGQRTAVYDPGTGGWTSAGLLRESRTGFSLVALRDGGALVIGGNVPYDAGEFGTGVLPTSTAERFDASTGSWSDAGILAVEAFHRAALLLGDGRVLVAGGDVSASEPDLDSTPAAFTALTEIFDPVDGAWSAVEDMPGARADAKAILLADGSALVVTGFSAPPAEGDTPSCPEPGDGGVFRYVSG